MFPFACHFNREYEAWFVAAVALNLLVVTAWLLRSVRYVWR